MGAEIITGGVLQGQAQKLEADQKKARPNSAILLLVMFIVIGTLLTLADPRRSTTPLLVGVVGGVLVYILVRYSGQRRESIMAGHNANSPPRPAGKPVSLFGGVILIIALLILVIAWAWHDLILSGQASSTGSALKLSDDMWDLGVILAVLGATAVAFDNARKQ